jgi:hypothetical protein
MIPFAPVIAELLAMVSASLAASKIRLEQQLVAMM